MKKIVKLTACLVSVLLLIESMPLVSFAETLNSGSSAYALSEPCEDDLSDIPDPDSVSESEAEIIGEITEERELCAKKFRMSDGSIVKAVYPYNVHYEENGELKEIDNSLSEIEDAENDKVLGNTSNIFNVKFKKKSNKNKLYDLEYKGNKIRVSIDGVKKVTAKKVECQDNLSELSDGFDVRNTSSTVVYENI